MKTLDLSGNKFNLLILESSISNLYLYNTNVQIFFFNENNLKNFSILNVAGLETWNFDSLIESLYLNEKIKELYFSNTKVKSLDFILQFSSLKSLNKLFLSHNYIIVVLSYHFESLENLAIIDLSFNLTEFIDTNAFSVCVNLDHINLENNRLRFFCYSELTSPILSILNLNHNHIENIYVEVKSSAIELIDLSNNYLTRIKFKRFINKFFFQFFQIFIY